MVGSLATDFVECHSDQQVPEIATRTNLVLAFLESAEKTAVNRLEYVFGIDIALIFLTECKNESTGAYVRELK